MIHNTAIIDPKANIADNVVIGAYSCIGANVTIGTGCEIGPHVVISGSTVIGSNNKIFQFASIGADCQDKKYAGEPTELIIGNNNVFREFCSIHRGTVQGGGITRIGSNNLFMAYTHVAHDCILANNIVLANNASLAGHIIVADFAIFGAFSAVHQFCAVGAYSFIAAGSIVYKDIPPFVMASGYPAKATGLNTVGLERNGFNSASIAELKQAYKIIYRSSSTILEANAKLQQLLDSSNKVALFIEFLDKSTRGIIR